MEIWIKNLPAAIRKGTSFQFITENRFFTGSDAYTLNIEFPLRGCSQNLRIFGHIGRMDVSKDNVCFDCEIRDGAFFRLGTITITSITPDLVKTQFLEGRSEQNFASDFDELYINELDLGTPTSISLSSISPASAWEYQQSNKSYVALPWVNASTGNIQNRADYSVQEGRGLFSWSTENPALSFQPYLIYILRMLGRAIGYSMDLSSIEDSIYADLLICNTLPAAWEMPEFAKALPHWSVTEFFEEIEKLLSGYFSIDHRSKSISFAFSGSVIEQSSPVYIDRVIDNYTTDISSDEDQCEFSGSANIAYSDPGNDNWKYCSCNWLLDYLSDYKMTSSGLGSQNVVVSSYKVQQFDTFRELYAAAYAIKDSQNVSSSSSSVKVDTSCLLYAKDINTYFTLYTQSYDVTEVDRRSVVNFHYRLLPINVFGDRIVKTDNSNSIELKIVPACIADTDATFGDILQLDCGSLDSEEVDLVEGIRSGRVQVYTLPVRACKNGEKNGSIEYFDKIFIAFYDGMHMSESTPSFLPRPAVDALCLRSDWHYEYVRSRNLRLNESSQTSPHRSRYVINTEQKFTFSFLSHTIPDVHSLFHIDGHRYLCEKITSTFTEHGMSELQKGIFYEVLEVHTTFPDINLK